MLSEEVTIAYSTRVATPNKAKSFEEIGIRSKKSKEGDKMDAKKCKDCKYFRNVVTAIWCSQAQQQNITPNDSYDCFTEKQKLGYENYQSQNKNK